MLPTNHDILETKQKQLADFGNDRLYELCREQFYHKQDDQIYTKVLFIGRIYAAAVERRKKYNHLSNDDFYLLKVIPAFRKSKLDQMMGSLKKKKLQEKNIPEILEVHQYLTNLLFGITGLNKRSFSSKYLHFHLPDLFFIYDSRAVAGLRNFTRRVNPSHEHILGNRKIDNIYASYFCKCFELKMQIEKERKIWLSTRQLDNLLIKS